MATAYTDATAGRVAAWPLQGRTDAAGVEVTGEHFDGEDAGILLTPYTGGRRSADAFQVAEDSPAAMTVVVGSGTVGDVAFVEGSDPLQPTYGVAWPDATTDITVNAADLSNPRIDEIYLVVQDDAYDTSGNVLPRLAYRDGTPAGSPAAPGPDASWDAFLLLASILVPAGATEIVNGDITAGVTTQLIDDLVATDSIQDEAVTGAKGAPAFLQSFEVDASTEVASQALTGTYATVASVSLSIPADWNSWKCFASVTYLQEGIGSAGTFDAKLRIDGTDQQPIAGAQALNGARHQGAIVARRTGIATTGSRQVILQARETVGDVDFIDIALYARAVRTS